MNVSPRSRDELLARIDTSWRALRTRLDKLEPDQLRTPLRDGRTVAEAMAGIAFWNETCAPVFAWLRGQPELPESRWYGGSDLGIAPGDPWPKDDVHHARESAWARSVSHAEVRARLDAAHAAVITTINSISAAELAALADRTSPAEGVRDDVPAEHPWARLSNVERMWSKATDCTYELYDELRSQLADA